MIFTSNESREITEFDDSIVNNNNNNSNNNNNNNNNGQEVAHPHSGSSST